jgi:hypothetical protein
MRHLISPLSQNQLTEAKAVLPVILDRPSQYEAKLEDPQITIAALIAQVDHLKAENHSLKSQVRELQESLDRRAVELPLPVLPARRPIEFRHNDRGHYMRDHVWEVKENNAMVRFCLMTLKWIGLFTFGFALALILASGFNQMLLVDVLMQLAQNIWKPMVTVGLLSVAIAWWAEAV